MKADTAESMVTRDEHVLLPDLCLNEIDMVTSFEAIGDVLKISQERHHVDRSHQSDTIWLKKAAWEELGKQMGWTLEAPKRQRAFRGRRKGITP